jgi:hypothetical protein
MATIIKRGKTYRVQVRKKGTAPQSKSFTNRKDAKRWAEQIEGKLALGAQEKTPCDTTLGEALRRYLLEITPSKRGHVQERNRMKAWLKDPLASRSLSSIRGVDIAEWQTAGRLKAKPLQRSRMPYRSSLRLRCGCYGMGYRGNS